MDNEVFSWRSYIAPVTIILIVAATKLLSDMAHARPQRNNRFLPDEPKRPAVYPGSDEQPQQIGRWYVAKNKQKLGPFTDDQMKQMASIGKIQPTDMVLEEGKQKWEQAHAVEVFWLKAKVASSNNNPVVFQDHLPATGEGQKPSPEVTRSYETRSPGHEGTGSSQRPNGQASQTPTDQKPLIQAIGRYRVEKILGKGGFGVVYLAHDDDLQRLVAIKVPQANRIRSPKDAEAYLVEAQILAGLDHPHIVPVFDVGRSEDGLPYVVSKFIEGSDLAHRIKQARLSFRESAILIARMAEALQYAHQHRLVHRDVKPGNILLDTSNKPFLVDFGLALKEEDFGKGGGILGTPAYMSPEQAKGEGHLVDGRSDIFSLGVVLYELFAGRRPFEGDSIDLVLFQIATVEPCPLRQIDPAIPKELERITLKALAKKASERYPTALDFADDLQHWLKPETTTENGPASVKIIPKGLRSFDAEDTDFFLELLPGPRDREGLPETLRFWKTRIEEKDADKTFRVGVIYGPSGCGKSSFVKAGLLPRLANTVRVVYVEATPEDSEVRLLRGLEKACPDLPKSLSLREAITHLRREERLRQKVVLVVDQFEQWLHAKSERRERRTDSGVAAVRRGTSAVHGHGAG